MDKKLNSYEQGGYAIVILVIILALSTAVALFSFRSSQHRTKKVGVKSAVTGLKNQSETAFLKAVQRIQAISVNQDTIGKTGSTPKRLFFLVGDVAPTTFLTEDDAESASSSTANKPCDYTVSYNLDSFLPGSLNVVCNFLGDAEPDVNVSVTRKNNVVENGNVVALFLINAVAQNEDGRRHGHQGLVGIYYVPSDISGTGRPVIRGEPFIVVDKVIAE